MGRAREEGSLDLEGQRALAAVLAGIGSKPVQKLRVGRYEIGESLGRGGCGQVFAARDPKLDREVAIKVVAAGRERDGQPRDRAAEARLVREGQALARLAHPNAVKVYDVGIDDMGASLGGGGRRGVYIVMERIRGRTLSQWLREESPTPTEIVRAYLDAARGLAAAHAVGVVHRDFKPGNAMVTADGTVIVLDFGLATALDEWATQDTDAEIAPSTGSASGSMPRSGGASAASLTATGVVMGTPRYMAPEQHAARPATPATDQYAWCVALWEALTGAPPFVASSIEALAQVKRAGKLPSAPQIAPHLRVALARGMAADPSRRFESMAALVDAVERGSWRRRARGIALLCSLAGVAVAATVVLPDAVPGLCTRAEDPSARPWSEPRNAELAADLAARPEPPLPLLVDRVKQRLDRFSRGWDATHASVCGSAGEASTPATRQIQAECLERAAQRWEEARTALTLGDRQTLPWLSELWALQNPARCATPEAERSFSTKGDEPPLREARAFVEAAMFGEGPTLDLDPDALDRALEVADRFGDHALAANALTLRARVHSQTGAFGDATRIASLAAWRARSGDDTLLAAEILPEAIFMSVIRGAPPHEIDAMLASGRELQTAPDAPPELRASLDHAEAFALEFRGDLDRALHKYLDNWAHLRAEPLDASKHLLTQALEGAAGLYDRRGEYAAAVAMYERAIESVVTDDPEDRAMIVANARSRQAEAALFAGDLDTAAIASTEAVQLFSTSGVATPEHIAMEIGQYGYILGVRGHLVEGRALLEVGLQRLRELGRAPMLPQLQHQLAHLFELADEPAAAVQLVQQLRAVLVDNGMSRPGHEASTWAWIASLKARAGDIEGAAAALAQAEEDVAAMKAAADAEGGESRPIPEELVDRARAEVFAARGDWPAAREAALDVLADPALHDGTPLSQGELGVVYWLLARATAQIGDREGALEIAGLADAALATADPSRRSRRAALATWRSSL